MTLFVSHMVEYALIKTLTSYFLYPMDTPTASSAMLMKNWSGIGITQHFLDEVKDHFPVFGTQKVGSHNFKFEAVCIFF